MNEVCDGSIYFASPESFNDPLDTKPSLVGDSSEQDKEYLFRSLYLSQFSNKDVASKISELRHLSTEHGDANQKYNYGRLLMSRIENIFFKEIRSYGVLSLAQNWNCPVMWSHYAEQHTGICLEFSTDKDLTKNLSRVRYDATRSIEFQDLASWKLKCNKTARKKVLDISLLSKAPAWSYECEWRVISKSPGLRSTPFDISAIHFGERCP